MKRRLNKDAEEKRKKILEDNKRKEEEKKKKEEEDRKNGIHVIHLSEEIIDESKHEDLEEVKVKPQDDRIEAAFNRGRGRDAGSPKNVNRKAVNDYVKSEKRESDMLEHKYKEPIKTVFKHRLVEFDQIEKKVKAQSEVFEEKKIKGVLGNNVQIDNLTKEQLDQVQADLKRNISNERQNEISDYINSKMSNIESDKIANENKEKVLKYEDERHQKWLKFKEKLENKNVKNEESKSNKIIDKTKKELVGS